MRIKFLKGDPRAGMVVELDSNRAEQFIAQGLAEKVNPHTEGAPATPSKEQAAIIKAAQAAAANDGTAKPEAKKTGGKKGKAAE
jgi:hypothetical protein